MEALASQYPKGCQRIAYDRLLATSAPIGISERSILPTPLRRLGEASRRLIRLWFEMHYFAHLVVCRIGRIQPSDPLLPTFYVVKESPVSRTTTVADPVKVGGGQDFQSGWRGVVFDAIELAQIIAITDLCDNLTCFRAFLVNKVQTNEVRSSGVLSNPWLPRRTRHIPSLTPLLNPHRASRTAGALPTAISCLGAFRTPAASACTDDRHRRRPKTCT